VMSPGGGAGRNYKSSRANHWLSRVGMQVELQTWIWSSGWQPGWGEQSGIFSRMWTLRGQEDWMKGETVLQQAELGCVTLSMPHLGWLQVWRGGRGLCFGQKPLLALPSWSFQELWCLVII
jgi:hypothetical protein